MEKDQLVERIRTLTQPLSVQPINHPTKLQRLNDIRCVAFDFYGTMFISGVGDIGIDEEQQADGATHFTEALQATDLRVLDKEVGKTGIRIFKEIIEQHINEAKSRGITYPEPDILAVWEDVLHELASKKIIKGEVLPQTAKLFGIEFEFRINNIWPVKNLEQVLNKLLENKLTLGIISNSQFYTPLAFEASFGKSLEQFGFNKHLMVWSFAEGRKKPSREFYESFVKRAESESIQPPEVLYVGNNIRKDVAPAKELGMKTALYVGDQRSIRHEEKDLENTRYAPDLVIDNLNQILECV